MMRCKDSMDNIPHAPHWHVVRAENIVYAQGQCNGIEPEDCEHGLSAALCAGPDHYPAEDGPDMPVTLSDAAGQYHAQGLPCPFDCAACDPYDYEYAMDTEHGIDFPVERFDSDNEPPF